MPTIVRHICLRLLPLRPVYSCHLERDSRSSKNQPSQKFRGRACILIVSMRWRRSPGRAGFSPRMVPSKVVVSGGTLVDPLILIIDETSYTWPMLITRTSAYCKYLSSTVVQDVTLDVMTLRFHTYQCQTQVRCLCAFAWVSDIKGCRWLK